jgi:CRISPR/Cas system-associated endoribonuclease Cas2
VCYDVADQKRLRKLARYLYYRCSGGQKSALNLHISDDEFVFVVDRIKTITATADMINIIPANSTIVRYGKNSDFGYNKGAIIL